MDFSDVPFSVICFMKAVPIIPPAEYWQASAKVSALLIPKPIMGLVFRFIFFILLKYAFLYSAVVVILPVIPGDATMYMNPDA